MKIKIININPINDIMIVLFQLNKKTQCHNMEIVKTLHIKFNLVIVSHENSFCIQLQ